MKNNLLCVVLLVLLSTSSVTAVEIHAPWIPGETWDYDRTTSRFHRDVDDNCVDFNNQDWSDRGSPILSVADGQASLSEWSNSYGWNVRVEEADGSIDLYAHLLQKPSISVDEQVKAGQVIGLCGCTPDGPGGEHCGGYHVHYGHYVNGESERITIIDSQAIDTGCCPRIVSHNTAILDQAYNRYGSAMIGYPEYRMWDLETARRANSNHPWYYPWDANDLYDARGMPRNCAIWHFDGGFFGDNAIIYDALGGARAAIVLHSGLWTFWTQRGGPRCPANMPIRDESNVSSNLRSYYKENFRENGVTRLDGISAIQECTDGVMLWANGQPHFAWYPYCAPGYYEDGWHADTGYLFVECYNRNGGSQNLGHAYPVSPERPSRVHNWGDYKVQDFQRPDGSKAIIFYDPNGAAHNSCTAEAHCVYDRKILPYFEANGNVNRFGYPTTDQFEANNRIAQEFYEHNSGKHWRLETDGANVFEIDLSRCVDENKMAKAMSEECYRSPDDLIANGSFESCLDCWETPIWPTEHCDINLAPPMAEFVMHGNADIWSVQLSQTLPRIAVGERMILTYEQQSVRTVHTILGLTEQVNGQYVNCGLWQDYRQSPGGWEEHRFPITITRTTSGAKLTWAFGETGGSMFRIRNIRLVPDNSPPPPPPPPPVCTGEDDPGSFISNGDFTHGLDCWQFTKPAGLDWLVPVVQPDHALRVSVDHARQWHEISFFQEWVYTQAGTESELVFTGAANPPCTIIAAIECSDGSKPLWQEVTLNPTSANQPIALSCWPSSTSANAKLVFYLGQDAGSFWL